MDLAVDDWSPIRCTLTTRGQTLNAGARPGDQCVPTGRVLLSQKLSSLQMSPAAVVGASLASAAVLRMC